MVNVPVCYESTQGASALSDTLSDGLSHSLSSPHRATVAWLGAQPPSAGTGDALALAASARACLTASFIKKRQQMKPLPCASL